MAAAALTAVHGLGFACVGLEAAGSAGFVRLVGMGRFVRNASICMIVGLGATVTVVRHAKDMILDLSFFSVIILSVVRIIDATLSAF